MVGGVGIRRGRRDPNKLVTGDALDFWRVEKIERGTFLRLRAEMKVPGLAWLEFTVTPITDQKSTLTQRAIFFPQGLGGRLYWMAVTPLHGIVFAGMAKSMGKAAEQHFSARVLATTE
jgi:hypothetical protein